MSVPTSQVEMFLSRAWANHPDRKTMNREDFESAFVKASKKLSQLIAKAWLPDKYPEGKAFRDVLVGNLQLEDDELRSKNIKLFLQGEGIDIDIDAILTNNKRSVLVLVNWDSFYGDLTERGFQYSLPYPPKPAEVTEPQLDKWIKDDTDNIVPNDPYIPVSLF